MDDQLSFLMSLKWNSFERYPEQGTDVYLHCYCAEHNLHRFLKIKNFNAVCFNCKNLITDYPDSQWEYSWLPAYLID